MSSKQTNNVLLPYPQGLSKQTNKVSVDLVGLFRNTLWVCTEIYIVGLSDFWKKYIIGL